jgi:N-acetylneuraminic acid mutarotase
MNRAFRAAMVALVLTGLAVGQAAAHFVFVVPAESRETATVVFSESLEPDADVDDSPLAGLLLEAATDTAPPQPLKVVDTGEVFSVELPEAVRQLRGRLDYGVMSRGGSEPFLLVYHPKAVIGDPFAKAEETHDDGVQLSLVGRPGQARFVLRHDGKPVADAAVRLVLPDGSEEELLTDAEGATPAVAARGQLAAWARHFEATPGEHLGEAYGEIRHYPSLVVDVPAEGEAAAASGEAALTKTRMLPPLPEAASSLAAVACDGWVYVYGGHISPVHTYTTEGVSGRFHRMSLADPTAWEELPSGPGLQGMNVAAHDGRIYRVGGMQPRNLPGEEADNASVTSAACFDPAVGTWQPLPDLPEGRSSHDVAVIGNTLYVVGGWDMQGADGGEVWADTLLALDLSGDSTEAGAAWQVLPQPFIRRALIAAVADGKLFVLGGFTDSEEVSQRVDVFDPATGQWSTGPDLPGGGFNGFAPAACTIEGSVFISVADGGIHRLAADGSAWEPVATVSPRIVHRMVPLGNDAVVLLGGAHRRDNLDVVEVVPLR